jgi:hypothetical protein
MLEGYIKGEYQKEKENQEGETNPDNLTDEEKNSKKNKLIKKIKAEIVENMARNALQISDLDPKL